MWVLGDKTHFPGNRTQACENCGFLRLKGWMVFELLFCFGLVATSF